MTVDTTLDTGLLEFPADGAGWAAYLDQRSAQGLTRARAAVAELKDGRTRSGDEVAALWNGVDLAVRAAGSLAAVLAEVHPDEAIRSLAEERSREAQLFVTELGQDRELYEVLRGAEGGVGDPEAARLVRLTLRDFRRAGVDRDERTRQRLRELVEREVTLGQEFSRAIRDDVRSIAITPDRLAGLPEDYRASHQPGPDGLVTITTDYPDYVPFRTFAHDAQARLDLTVAFLNRGWPDNDERLRELLAVRHEHATLLGYPGWPDFDAEIKMVGRGAAIGEFIDRIAEAAAPSAAHDRAILLARLREDRPDVASVTAADTAYYGEVIRRERFHVDAGEVRRYFDFPAVREGLLAVTGRLFGLRYDPVDVPTWHPDVASYDVRSTESGELLGRIYLDLHPREGKYKHAAQFDLVAGVAGHSLPEGALVCNFSRGLLEHSDVVTLFHEFGHLIHHVLAGRQRLARFSGVATEWDFVEAPSQLLEEWAWDAAVLHSFARDAGGEPIPHDLVARMRAGKEFGKGYLARTQMFYAAVSYYLHRQPDDDLTGTVRELQRRYDSFDYLPGTHFHASFGHLEGYTSGYYTYMWSLVIAKDLFSAFDTGDLFDATVARRYRDAVLAPGGSRDAADLVADFLGRPYTFDSFARWLDQPAGE